MDTTITEERTKESFQDFVKRIKVISEQRPDQIDAPSLLAEIETYTAIPGYVTPTVTELLAAPAGDKNRLIDELFTRLTAGVKEGAPQGAQDLPQFHAEAERLNSSLPSGPPSEELKKTYETTGNYLKGRQKKANEFAKRARGRGEQWNKAMREAQFRGYNETASQPSGDSNKEAANVTQAGSIAGGAETITPSFGYTETLTGDAFPPPIIKMSEDPVAVAIVETILTVPTVNHDSANQFIESFTSSIKPEEMSGAQISEKARQIAVATVVATTPKIDAAIKLTDLYTGPMRVVAGVVGNLAPVGMVAEKGFMKIATAEDFVGKVTARVGHAADEKFITNLIKNTNRRIIDEHNSAGALLSTASSVVSNVAHGPTDEQAVEFFKVLHDQAMHGKPGATLSRDQLIAFAFLSMPGNTATIRGTGPNATLVLGSAATSVAGGGFKKIISGILGKLGFAGGPITGVATSVAADAILTRVIDFGGRLSSGFFALIKGDFMSGKFSLDDPVALLPLVIIAAIVLLFVFPSFLNFSSFRDDIRHDTLAISMTGMGGGGEGPGVGASIPGSGGSGSSGGGNNYAAPPVSMASPNYTGPQPTNTLQCLNFNVSGPYGHPLTSTHATELNTAIDQYKQIGLYNCLLQCPQNQIGVYGDTANGRYYGEAPVPAKEPLPIGQGSVIFYDYLFNTVPVTDPTNPDYSKNILAMARIVAHEFAHELSYFHPEAMNAFMNGTTGPDTTTPGSIIKSAIPKGYCGHPLCTYPSGFYGTCSSLETTDETFAEAAAMYLTGEDLYALCPASFYFMQQLFGQCAAPTSASTQ